MCEHGFVVFIFNKREWTNTENLRIPKSITMRPQSTTESPTGLKKLHQTNKRFILLQWLCLDLRYLLLIRGNGRWSDKQGGKTLTLPHHHYEGGAATSIKMEM